MRRSYLALALVPLLWGAACSVYDTSLLESNAGGDGGSGGTDGTGGTAASGGTSPGGSGGTAVCEPKTYPSRPTDPPQSARDFPISVVMRSLDLGDDVPAADTPTRYRTVGFDLDGKCSTEATKKDGECVLPSYATGSVDGPNGIDNAIGATIQFVRGYVTDFSSTNYSAKLEEGGVSSVLIRVSNYNGEANDASVTVDALVTAAFAAGKDDPTLRPKWDGTDAFPIASDSTIDDDPDKPRFVDRLAYVRDNKVVATLNNVALRLDVGLANLQTVRLKLALGVAFVVCTITDADADAGGGFTLKDCTLAGKWQADDLVHQLSQFPDPALQDDDKAPPLCNKPGSAYENFRNSICGLTDVSQSGQGPGVVCDSLSFGVNFQTSPGRAGNIFTVNDATDRCPPGQQPSDDSCASLDPDADAGSSGGATGSGGARASGGAAASGGTSGSGGAPASGGADAGEDDGGPDASSN